ncbi:MAG: phosphate regulon sensor histidine kinase PhoR, partial [Betaproteobacteria bacterium]|nr:phosphate regulon sensor histidine kinase PhoR [Betaproteobacteria bacterium]
WGVVAQRVNRLVMELDQQFDESEDRLLDFFAALNASPNGVVLLDDDGRIEWFNQTASSHFGLDIQKDQQQHFGNLVRDPAFAAYVAAGDFREDLMFSGKLSTPSGPIKLSVQLFPYGEGRRLLLSRDVTSLEQADAMRRDFVANVSHEIRTPLTVLAGFIETLQSLKLEDEEREQYLALMSQQATRMQTLVNDLLTLSRLEGTPFPGMNEWVSVQSLLVQIEQDAQALSSALYPKPLPAQTVVLKIEQEDEIAGASTELYSAFSNLVNNAVRYTPAGETIQVTWKRLPDGRGEYVVQDSGPGIGEDHISRLTERFYRVDRSRSRDTGGTGLGLAIVKHVVQRHGGELSIQSSPGQGSRFSIVLPSSRLRLAQENF